ncbi:hypothetical protein GCM10007415_09450 [Parapedobacter pyrenivorans]|uniref:Uncharacterized protein n=2 Tax=Parapedobacter pyrenivorans TaxID=1305674 RepID=A0A917HHV3_9SPHI|nr:hypothetical protein GCM10007415_09450 [Parapedobacter pyrenivorans]
MPLTNREKMRKSNFSKLCWFLSSGILISSGILHIHGIFFSSDLHPAPERIAEQLKTTSIQMDQTGNFWNLWIGFNAMFGAGLVFMGSLLLYLTRFHFNFLSKKHYISILYVCTLSFFVWIGQKYMIDDFTLVMIALLALYAIGFVLPVVTKIKPDENL